jgi:exoribonuclease R
MAEVRVHAGQDRAGFDGIITGVTGFGLFVELRGVFVEGLIHVTALRNDYYQFDPVGHRSARRALRAGLPSGR